MDTRTIVLIDGQNLYHLARKAWASGPKSPYGWPSYDVEKLAQALVSRVPGRTLAEIRFYTGVPDPAMGGSEFWHGVLVEQDQVSEEPRDLRLQGKSELWKTGEGRGCQPSPRPCAGDPRRKV